MRVPGPLFLAAILVPAPFMLGAALIDAPILLLNTSPSEPVGIYRRVSAEPTVGALIAFRPPASARSYLRIKDSTRPPASFLKTVAAAEGALACGGADLRLDGRSLGPIAVLDQAGRALPRWNGCRRLASGEYFVFSDRIPNSFDSRYYGSVRRDEILGVYAPLWTTGR